MEENIILKINIIDDKQNENDWKVKIRDTGIKDIYSLNIDSKIINDDKLLNKFIDSLFYVINKNLPNKKINIEFMNYSIKTIRNRQEVYKAFSSYMHYLKSSYNCNIHQIKFTTINPSIKNQNTLTRIGETDTKTESKITEVTKEDILNFLKQQSDEDKDDEYESPYEDEIVSKKDKDYEKLPHAELMKYYQKMKKIVYNEENNLEDEEEDEDDNNEVYHLTEEDIQDIVRREMKKSKKNNNNNTKYKNNNIKSSGALKDKKMKKSIKKHDVIVYKGKKGKKIKNADEEVFKKIIKQMYPGNEKYMKKFRKHLLERIMKNAMISDKEFDKLIEHRRQKDRTNKKKKRKNTVINGINLGTPYSVFLDPNK